MFRRYILLLLCLALAVTCCLSSAVSAEKSQEVVRVGWYETPFNHKDSFGRRTGYAYEYQRKIAAYTGWQYEYVEGTWPELLQLLEEGRIDLMSDVSYKDERTAYMLYTSLPMGQEIYYLYIANGSTAASSEDYASLNGKKVGVTKDSIQKDIFLQWEAEHSVTTELVELETSELDSFELMKKGEIDAFITLDTYNDPDVVVPLWKIGSSDFYFAVSKDRPDLLAGLDAALSRIQDENKHYNEQLNAKYLRNPGTNHFLTAEEREWLEDHGPIRVGYQDHYLAFCAADPATGELTGALKDYLAFASGTLENGTPEFEAQSYPTAAAAMEALANGEVDCMFPANLTDYDAEQAGLVLSPPLMRTEMDAVVREADTRDFLRRDKMRVGVNRGNPNYEMFLLDHFPSWTPVYYSDTPACLDAVAAGSADCIIVSNYRFQDISDKCRRLNLTTVYTGVDMDYSFAVREGNTTLYSILSKMIGQVPESTVNAALTYYSAGSSGSTSSGIFRDYPVLAFGGSVLILLLILCLILALRAKKKSGGH